MVLTDLPCFIRHFLGILILITMKFHRRMKILRLSLLLHPSRSSTRNTSTPASPNTFAKMGLMKFIWVLSPRSMAFIALYTMMEMKKTWIRRACKRHWRCIGAACRLIYQLVRGLLSTKTINCMKDAS